MTTYTKRWFAGQVATSLASADVVAPLAADLLRPASVVDLGCGLGAWLAAFNRLGITDILGVDGDYIDRSMLKIPADKFRAHDLASPPDAGILGRGFDLAISVEVAEHLPESSADHFVAALTSLAPAVLFSAAVPGQGGNRHINEQWQGYWAEKFAARGYAAADAFRPAIWTDARVEWWYRQNLLLYVSPERLADDPRLADLVAQTRGRPLDIVHPEMYQCAHSLAAHPGRTLVQTQFVAIKQAVKKILPG